MSDARTPPCSEAGLSDPGPMTPERIARIAKALGHPARIEILDQFHACIPHVVGEIVDETPLAQSTVSEHLRILRDADVLFVREDGPRHWYCMRRSVIADFAAAVAALAEDMELAEAG
ncbi:MAG: metalloregulator ArsR/SmtB family transcription factor [Acidimicrobiia bacterium]|nr:metalloregulator ArsR/SmtB family transcription factor [Acidimicrobiia bacterium]